MTKPVYVIGHRNPDTDSICSAIGYAHLKQAAGVNALAARAGKINAETKFVLDYFGVKPPVLISDLYPKAKDIMTSRVVTAYPWQTLRELGQIMLAHNVKSVPVVDQDDKLSGIVSVGDLAKRYFNELEMQNLYEAGVDFAGVLRTLSGKLACGENLERKITGRVRIAAAQTKTMLRVIRPGDVVLVGDRITAQLAVIEQGIACLIVTGNADVDPAVKAAAQSRGIIIIEAPYDTYTCARLINQSIPVSRVMQREVVTFKPDDLVSDIKDTIVATRHRNYPVLKNGRLVGLIDRDRLIRPEREQIILVDHNERSQAVEGIEEAHIIEIIDHHRLGGLETGEPIFIRHDPVGSTATIVANMHWHRNIEIPPVIAGLLLAAVISDTVMFKSPTSTDKDRETAEKLAKIAGLDVRDFGIEVLRAGSNIRGMTAADIVHNDLKEFQMGEYHVAIGQISVMEPQQILSLAGEITAYMENLRSKQNYDLVILMVTDIVQEASTLIYTGYPVSLIKAAFHVDGDGQVTLPKVMSRKKQVVPPMLAAARELN
ncbi:MAG: putative manganese-dependent inorganic diphosphatase [Negativicutes bacterium]|nr:putative manganese-dependent inorganic diphosphatase [Negativicutes bacterium]